MSTSLSRAQCTPPCCEAELAHETLAATLRGTGSSAELDRVVEWSARSGGVEVPLHLVVELALRRGETRVRLGSLAWHGALSGGGQRVRSAWKGEGARRKGGPWSLEVRGQLLSTPGVGLGLPAPTPGVMLGLLVSTPGVAGWLLSTSGVAGLLNKRRGVRVRRGGGRGS